MSAATWRDVHPDPVTEADKRAVKDEEERWAAEDARTDALLGECGDLPIGQPQGPLSDEELEDMYEDWRKRGLLIGGQGKEKK